MFLNNALSAICVAIFIMALLNRKSCKKMMPIVLEGYLWVMFKIIKIFMEYPKYLFGLFNRRKQCPPINNEILLIPANILVKKICSKQISSKAVILAYIERIKTVNPFINAVVDNCFAEALINAVQVDDFILKSDLSTSELQEKYPLLGIPITIKESIAAKGLSHTAGLVSLNGRKAVNDANIVQAAKLAGAIPMLVSNTPELCLNWETKNKVTGTSCNPYDTRKTTGGSSGGEAALIGSAASLIGLGSDVAGSLRLPSHFCGVYGHKPSPGVVSPDGHFPACGDKIAWRDQFTLGPMARYASDLSLLFKVIVKPECQNMLKLTQEVNLRRFKIFYMESNGSLLSSTVDKEILSSMKNVLNHFESKHCAQIEKINIKLFKYSHVLSFIPLISIDGVDDIFYNNPNGGSASMELLKFFFCSSKSQFTSINYLILQKAAKSLYSKKTIEKIQKKNIELKNQLEALLNEDAVFLYPTFPSVAHYHGLAIPKVFDTTYMTIFNSLGLPVTNCPIGLNSKGLPMGMQIVAKTNCDRLSLAIAEEIDKTCGGWKPITNNNKQ